MAGKMAFSAALFPQLPIWHDRIKRYANAGRWHGLPLAIEDCSSKGIGPKMVRIYLDRHAELLICSLHCLGKWLGWSTRWL